MKTLIYSATTQFGFSRAFCRCVGIVFLVVTFALPSRADDAVYVVKPRDTLYGIAKQNNITVNQLAERNGISRTAKIYVGQRLRIPGKSAAHSAPTLNTTVQKAINNAPVKSRRWKYIVIHHSGVNEGTLAGTDRYHREVRHMENGMAYHFLIGNGHGMGDGQIGVGNRWKKQQDGGHLHSLAQNRVAIGICLVGNFDKSKPSPKQLEALEALTRALMKRCKLGASAVKTHQQINVVHTRCPGTKFPARSFLDNLKH